MYVWKDAISVVCGNYKPIILLQSCHPLARSQICLPTNLIKKGLKILHGDIQGVRMHDSKYKTNMVQELSHLIICIRKHLFAFAKDRISTA
jgi:hypothetical protein